MRHACTRKYSLTVPSNGFQKCRKKTNFRWWRVRKTGVAIVIAFAWCDTNINKQLHLLFQILMINANSISYLLLLVRLYFQTGKSRETCTNENAKGYVRESPLHISCLLRNSMADIHYLERRRLCYGYAFLSNDTQIRMDNFSYCLVSWMKQRLLHQIELNTRAWSLMFHELWTGEFWNCLFWIACFKEICFQNSLCYELPMNIIL